MKKEDDCTLGLADARKPNLQNIEEIHVSNYLQIPRTQNNPETIKITINRR